MGWRVPGDSRTRQGRHRQRCRWKLVYRYGCRGSCERRGPGAPKILEAIRRQSDLIMHTTDITNPRRIELARRVSEVMPEGLRGNCHTSFFQAGSDAVETAIKFSRRHRADADHRLPRGIPRGLVRDERSYHRIQLPTRLGPAHRRSPASALRLLLSVPLRHDLPEL